MAARLIVLGRQGAGKGTQCARLAARLGVSHVSTGDLFRSEILARTALGQELERYVAAGELVPDDVVLDVLAANLGNSAVRSKGYLLDGFPRTVAQGRALFEVLGAGAADLAVDLDVPVEVVRARLGARRVCSDCGTVTSIDAEAADRRCVPCGGRLQRRSDDHPAAISRRLDLFDQQSGPLLTWFKKEGILVRVDGEGDPDDVHERFFAAVAERLPAVRAIAR